MIDELNEKVISTVKIKDPAQCGIFTAGCNPVLQDTCFNHYIS